MYFSRRKRDGDNIQIFGVIMLQFLKLVIGVRARPLSKKELFIYIYIFIYFSPKIVEKNFYLSKAVSGYFKRKKKSSYGH